MRFAKIFVVSVFLPALAFAQASPSPGQRYTFDPYKPSDLALIRQLGAGVLAQAPLSMLLQLDPYVPTEARLLREYGGALPLWPYAWYPMYPLAVYSPEASRAFASPPPPITSSEAISTFAELSAVLERTRASLAVAAGDRSVSSLIGLPQRSNKGVSIDYAGRTWVSAGRAVPFDDAQFVRVGERAGSPVFRRIGASEEIVYVPNGTGALAPFRATEK